MGTKTLALILLGGHVVVVVLTLLVVIRQIKIFRQRPDATLRVGRIVMSIFTGGVLLGNVVPILVEICFLSGVQLPRYAGLAYALSNVLTMIVLTGAVLALYVIAEKLLSDKSE